jgi:hypothetical protein
MSSFHSNILDIVLSTTTSILWFHSWKTQWNNFHKEEDKLPARQKLLPVVVSLGGKRGSKGNN